MYNHQQAVVSAGDAALQKFYDGLHQHRKNVLEAGLQIGGIPYMDLARHDLSKYCEEEFPYYARHFFGDSGDPEGFTRAWLHHLQHNDHHYQHWCLPESVSPAISNPGASALKDASINYQAHKYLPMPEVRIREMIADWIGASVTYTDSPDLTGWLALNLSKIVSQMHPETAARTLELLKGLSYEVLPLDVLLHTPSPVRTVSDEAAYRKLAALLENARPVFIMSEHEETNKESDSASAEESEGTDRVPSTQGSEDSERETDTQLRSGGDDGLGDLGSGGGSDGEVPEAVLS